MASLGQPISPFDGHKQPYHIAGSDASGIVWKVGDKVMFVAAKESDGSLIVTAIKPAP